MATTTQNKMSKKYYNMVAQQGRHPIPTLAMLRSPLVGKGFLTYRDVGNDCSYNHVAFPPYMEVRSADHAGDLQGRGKVEQRRSSCRSFYRPTYLLNNPIILFGQFIFSEGLNRPDIASEVKYA